MFMNKNLFSKGKDGEIKSEGRINKEDGVFGTKALLCWSFLFLRYRIIFLPLNTTVVLAERTDFDCYF